LIKFKQPDRPLAKALKYMTVGLIFCFLQNWFFYRSSPITCDAFLQIVLNKDSTINNCLFLNPVGGCGNDAFMPFRVLIATCGVFSRDVGIAPTRAHKKSTSGCYFESNPKQKIRLQMHVQSVQYQQLSTK
jgi:hypothetical protein